MVPHGPVRDFLDRHATYTHSSLGNAKEANLSLEVAGSGKTYMRYYALDPDQVDRLVDVLLAETVDLGNPVCLLSQIKDRPSHLCFDIDIKPQHGGDTAVEDLGGVQAMMDAIYWGIDQVVPYKRYLHHKEPQWAAWVYTGNRPDKPVSYHVHFPDVWCETKAAKQDVTRAITSIPGRDPRAAFLREAVDRAAIHGGLRIPGTSKLGKPGSLLRFIGIFRRRQQVKTCTEVTPTPPPTAELQVKKGIQWVPPSPSAVTLGSDFTTREPEEEKDDQVAPVEHALPPAPGYVDLTDATFAYKSFDVYANEIRAYCLENNYDGLVQYLRSCFAVRNTGSIVFAYRTPEQASLEVTPWIKLGTSQTAKNTLSFLSNLSIHEPGSGKKKATPVSQVLFRTRHADSTDVFVPAPPYHRKPHGESIASVNLWRGWLSERCFPLSQALVLNSAAWRTSLCPSVLYVLEYIWRDLCSQELCTFRALVCWIASVVQNPHEASEKAPVIVGPEGCGKSMLFELLIEHILGDDHTETVSAAGRALGEFQYHHDKVLIHIDEGVVHPEHMNTLKNLATSRKKILNRKFQDPIKVKNCLSFAFTCNTGAIPLDNQARRFFFCQANTETAQRNAGGALRSSHFARVVSAFESTESRRDMWRFFTQLDYDFIQTVPESVFTDMYRRQRLRFMHPTQKWYYQCLCNGVLFSSDVQWHASTLSLTENRIDFKYVQTEISQLCSSRNKVTAQECNEHLSPYGIKVDGLHIIFPPTLVEARLLFVRKETCFTGTPAEPCLRLEDTDMRKPPAAADGWAPVGHNPQFNRDLAACQFTFHPLR